MDIKTVVKILQAGSRAVHGPPPVIPPLRDQIIGNALGAAGATATGAGLMGAIQGRKLYFPSGMEMGVDAAKDYRQLDPDQKFWAY